MCAGVQLYRSARVDGRGKDAGGSDSALVGIAIPCDIGEVYPLATDGISAGSELGGFSLLDNSSRSDDVDAEEVAGRGVGIFSEDLEFPEGYSPVF